MLQAVVEVYNTLSLSAQQEVSDFIMYLAQKQKKTSEHIKYEKRKQKRMAALSEFAGSMKKTWKDVDALEYQNKMREERTLG